MSTNLLLSGYGKERGGLYLEVKRFGIEGDNTLRTIFEINNEWSSTFTALYAFMLCIGTGFLATIITLVSSIQSQTLNII
jgi:hypothetical protein